MSLIQFMILVCCMAAQDAGLASRAPMSQSPSSNPLKIVHTSVCALVQQGERANGTRVRLQAVYITDQFEGSYIKDSQCRSVGLAPYDAAEPELDIKSMKRFDRVVQGKRSDHTLRIFWFDISGKYVWRPNEKIHGAIYIEKVWSFKRLPHSSLSRL